MGLFRKTLEDAKKEIEKGELKNAHAILSAHQESELHAESDLRQLSQALSIYRKGIDFSTHLAEKGEGAQAMRHLESALDSLDKIKKHIKELKRDERIKLE
jgi:hypothetical protein